MKILCMYFYMKGYKGKIYSRLIRRFFAKTDFHRAWLSGSMGVFSEDGICFGVSNREWVRYRK